jgi:hypothetical protein
LALGPGRGGAGSRVTATAKPLQLKDLRLTLQCCSRPADSRKVPLSKKLDRHGRGCSHLGKYPKMTGARVPASRSKTATCRSCPGPRRSHARVNKPLVPRGFSPRQKAKPASRAAYEFRRIWRHLASDLARAFWGVGNPSPEHSDALVDGKAAQHAREKSSTAIGVKVLRVTTSSRFSFLSEA